MSTTTKTIVKNGLLYSIRPVNVMDGKVKKYLGDVHCPILTADNYQNYIDAGVITLQQIMEQAVKGLAVTLQQELRSPKKATATKVPKADYNRLFAIYGTIEMLTQAKAERPNDVLGYINEAITAIYEEEMATTEIDE